MQRIKISASFFLDEVMPPNIYGLRKEKSIELIDMRIVNVAQRIRDIADVPFMINTWFAGGDKTERGLRDPFTKTGAKFSQHKFGRALDIVPVRGITIEQLHQVVFNYQKELCELGLTTIERIEDAPTWLHIDCRFNGMEKKLRIVSA